MIDTETTDAVMTNTETKQKRTGMTDGMGRVLIKGSGDLASGICTAPAPGRLPNPDDRYCGADYCAAYCGIFSGSLSGAHAGGERDRCAV